MLIHLRRGRFDFFSVVTSDASVELGEPSRPPSVPTPQRQKYGPESAKKAAAVWRKKKAAFFALNVSLTVLLLPCEAAVLSPQTPAHS